MKYILWQVMCLVCYSSVAYAQVLHPEDVVRMRKAGTEQVDSMVKAKGFTQIHTPRDTAYVSSP